MNQYLYDDDALMAVFDEEQKPKQMKTLFSRYDEYSLYIGLDRENNKPLSITDYAKVYIRADTKKTDIRRTYQKLTEFYADASSLLIAIYEVLIIIISFINNFYAEQAIIKKLFIFKEIELKNFHFSQKSEKIHKLMTLSIKKNENNINKKNAKIEYNNIHFNTNIENTGKKNKYNFKKDLISNGSSQSKLRSRKIKINKEIKSSKNVITTSNIENENNDTSKKNLKNIRNALNLGDNLKNIEVNNTNTLEKEDNHNKFKENILKRKTTKFSFNIFEIIFISIIPCCLKGQLKLKNYINEKALNILYSKLNIILYARNMILFDIINKTILDEKTKDIINFLSRPILSLNKSCYEEKDIFYEGYKENDFDNFYESFSLLVKKPNKEEKEIRLAYLSKQQLKELI